MKNDRKEKTGIQWCQCIFDIYTGILLSAFILICSPYENITEKKYDIFLITCGSVIVLIMVSLIELMLLNQFTWQTIKNILMRRKQVITMVTIYLCFSLLSAILSPYKYNYWIGASRYEGVLTQLIYMLIFLFSSIFGRIKKIHIFILTGTMFIFSTLCILQLHGLNPFGLYPHGYNYYDTYIAYSGEYLGTIGNADLVSGLLSMMIMLGISFVFTKPKHIWVYIIPLAFNIMVLIGVGVASGILAVLCAISVITPLFLKLSNNKFWKHILITEVAIMVLIGMIIYTYDFNGSGTLYEFHEVLNGNLNPSFGSHRIKIWEDILRNIPNHLWFGTGPDSMAFWKLEGFTKYIDSLGYYIENGIDVAHNEYLNMLAQQGLFAFIAYILIIIYSIIEYAKSSDKMSKLIIVAPVVAYLFQAIFSFSMCMVAPIFWTFLGMLLNKGEISNGNENII